MDCILNGAQQVIPLGFAECWLGLVLNGVCLVNGKLDQRHLTGWQFIGILLGGSPGCHPQALHTLQ